MQIRPLNIELTANLGAQEAVAENLPGMVIEGIGSPTSLAFYTESAEQSPGQMVSTPNLRNNRDVSNEFSSPAISLGKLDLQFSNRHYPAARQVIGDHTYPDDSDATNVTDDSFLDEQIIPMSGDEQLLLAIKLYIEKYNTIYPQNKSIDKIQNILTLDSPPLEKIIKLTAIANGILEYSFQCCSCFFKKETVTKSLDRLCHLLAEVDLNLGFRLPFDSVITRIYEDINLMDTQAKADGFLKQNEHQYKL